MYPYVSRVGRWPLALICATLAACADDPAAARVVAPEAPRSPNAAVGDVITVTTASGGTEVGSLRWAASQATEGEIIRFAPNLANEIIRLSGPVVAQKYITIEGPRDGKVDISGELKTRVLELNAGGTLRNISVSRGSTDVGAGILSNGPLTLEHSTVYWNTAYTGAGILGLDITLINSTVAHNVAQELGSGIAYASYGKLKLINSTVAWNASAPGISAVGTLPGAPEVTLRNSIIAHNGSPATAGNCSSTSGFTYEGMNLSNDATCGSNSRLLVTNPRIWEQLGYSGGPTPSLPLYRDSPAINAGAECGLALDQRFAARDSLCDIGSFEFTDFTAVTFTIDPDVALNPTTGAAVVTGTVKCSADEAFTVSVTLGQNEPGSETSAIARGSGSKPVNCTTTAQPWRIAVAPTVGVFHPGIGAATAQTDNAPKWVAAASLTSPVRLAKSQK